MTVFNRLNIILPKTLIAICLLSVVLLCLVAAKYFMLQIPKVSVDSKKTTQSLTHISESDIPGTMNWKIFKPETHEIIPDGTPVEELYVLRGTFLVNSENGEMHRKAIIDDLKNSTQLIVNESEKLSDGRQVTYIGNDHIIMLNGKIKETLTLPFSTADNITKITDTSQNVDSDSLTNRYGGKRIGENEWSFQKDKIMQYYEELMANPKRLLNLFDSFEPVYNEQKRITGYKINIKGEKNFINAVGLQNGDYITKVNALRLTNRRRAEYMIGEFLEGRAGTFALEVERKDNPQRFLYRTY